VTGTAVTAVDGVAYGLLLFIAASGLTLTLGVARVTNLAHGTLFLTGGYLGWRLADHTWAGLAAGTSIAVAAGGIAGAGLAVALVAVRAPLDQALCTLGVALLGNWLLTRAFGAQPLPPDPPAAVAGTVAIAGHPYPVYRLLLIAAGVSLATGLYLVVHHTRTGLLIRATAADPHSVAILGIDPRRVQILTMAAGGALATTAGALGAPVLPPAPGTDQLVLVLSLIVAVGGAGSISGALATALAIGQVQTTAVATWPTSAPFLLFAVLALALAIRIALRPSRPP
jgi:branched-chain amino acid transport system permease protein